MNDLFLLLGVEGWKPVLTALALPPVPFLLLTLVGARMILWRRGLGWLVVLASVALLWLGHCTAVAEWLERGWLPVPPALSAERIAGLKREVAARRPVGIVVLGSGREALAPEYAVSSLSRWSLERLRYGVWLGRETGAPVAFSGGTGYGQAAGPSEAEVAARIAAQEFGRPLKWRETESRDTRENALRTLPMLRPERLQTLVVVTHGWHMPRALRAFEDAAAHAGMRLDIVAAPIGLAGGNEQPVLRWLPSAEGFTLTRQVLREKLGWWFGA